MANALDIATSIMNRCCLTERLGLDATEADIERHEIADEIMAAVDNIPSPTGGLSRDERERAAKLVETVELPSHNVTTREQVVDMLTRLAKQIRSEENVD